MEITAQFTSDELVLRIKGRLDGYWADHLTRTIEENIRQGAHQIRLNLAEVTYLSSAGIRVLVLFYKQLQGIQGSLLVTEPAASVKKILELAGLKELLVAPESAVSQPRPATSASSREFQHPKANFEIFDYVPGGTLTVRAVGQPERLINRGFGAEHSRTLPFPAKSFAIGLGAFGQNFEDCRNCFGEFLAVAGAAAYLPTDGSNVPDYLVAAGTLVPEVNVLYCLAGTGEFAQLARFEAKQAATAISLSEIASASMELAQSDTVGLVLVAEAAGLMGAALRRSPARNGRSGDDEVAMLDFPAIRDWLSFTAERAHARTLALVVGIASRAAPPTLQPVVRPLGADGALVGHFHAVVFSYRPLKKGLLDLTTTVTSLFESEAVRDVLHLVNDDRAIAGAGESEFVRGACWFGPVGEITKE